MAIPGSSTLSTLLSDSILHNPNRALRHCFHCILLFLCDGLDLFSKWLVFDRLSVEHDASHLGAADDEEEEVHGSQAIILLLANSGDINWSEGLSLRIEGL